MLLTKLVISGVVCPVPSVQRTVEPLRKLEPFTWRANALPFTTDDDGVRPLITGPLTVSANAGEEILTPWILATAVTCAVPA